MPSIGYEFSFWLFDEAKNLRGVSLLELSTSSFSGVLVASADDIVTC